MGVAVLIVCMTVIALAGMAGILGAYHLGVRQGYTMGIHAQTGRLPDLRTEEERRAEGARQVSQIEAAIKAARAKAREKQEVG